MTRKGGINKTRKAVAKRFKVTGTGKVLRRKQGKRHILQKKSSKRKRQLGKVALVDETQVWAVKQNLPFASTAETLDQRRAFPPLNGGPSCSLLPMRR